MKRVCFLIILIIIYFFIIKYKTKDVFAEKIDLKLDQNEFGIVIIDEGNYNFLLLKHNNENNIILLNLKENNTISKVLSDFDARKIDNFISENNYSINIDIDNKYLLNNNIILEKYIIEKNDNIIKIKLYDYNLCIYDTGNNNNINDCTFIYFENISDKIEINNQNKVVFYNSNVDEDFKEELYTKWIDIYTLDSDNYTILKVKNDNYNIINIPSKTIQ